MMLVTNIMIRIFIRCGPISYEKNYSMQIQHQPQPNKKDPNDNNKGKTEKNAERK